MLKRVRTLAFFIFSFVVLQACTRKATYGIFFKRTDREKYEIALQKDSGKNNSFVNSWLQAGELSLSQPLSVAAEYAEKGIFRADNSSATALKVFLRRGQKLRFELLKTSSDPYPVYLDLWSPSQKELLASADTSLNYLEYTVDQDDSLIARFQPALGVSGEYEITLLAGPSFIFPIGGRAKSHIGSFWGAGRENGARKHEGIDIFAAHRSPVVAVADGYITSTTENKLGGKVIFLNPNGTAYNVYYAHLDEQLVKAGDRVVAGQIIGLTGNTGNAKHTASHLHFGLYTMRGAIDPLVFVEKKKPLNEKRVYKTFQNLMITKKRTKLYVDLQSPLRAVAALEKNIYVITEASHGHYLRVMLPDGRKYFVEARDLAADAQLKS